MNSLYHFTMMSSLSLQSLSLNFTLNLSVVCTYIYTQAQQCGFTGIQ